MSCSSSRPTRVVLTRGGPLRNPRILRVQSRGIHAQVIRLQWSERGRRKAAFAVWSAVASRRSSGGVRECGAGGREKVAMGKSSGRTAKGTVLGLLSRHREAEFR